MRVRARRRSHARAQARERVCPLKPLPLARETEALTLSLSRPQKDRLGVCSCHLFSQAAAAKHGHAAQEYGRSTRSRAQHHQ
jgi:hypothetical protein